MPAHIRAALTLTSLAVPVQSGAPTVGTWQAISVGEHRAHPHRRTIALHDAGT
jgi:secondary thiamine-phosphate synthase enzyme